MEPDPRIVLRDYPPGELNNVIVDHPEQPADYVHTDGTAWTWRSRWRLVGGVTDEGGGRRGATRLRLYDQVVPCPSRAR